MLRGRMLGGVGALVTSGLALLPATSAAAATSEVVVLGFDGGTVGETVTAIDNSGATAGTTRVTVVTDPARAGSIRWAAGAPGSDTAADLPAFSPSGARAIVAVQNLSGTTDALAVGSQRLEFGADIVLDGGTTAVAGSTDDGNNVVQRGLYNDNAQFKLEVDGDRPRCRVKGSGSSVDVGAATSIAPRRWYRLRCVRPSGSNTVTLTVTPIAADGTFGTPVARSRTASGSIGSLGFARDVPLTVGGKLNRSLALASPSSDQFNGLIDNVVLRRG